MASHPQMLKGMTEFYYDKLEPLHLFTGAKVFICFVVRRHNENSRT